MRLGAEEIFYLNELSSVSGANARDCVVLGDTITFVVKAENMGKAIGKNALNIQKLSKKLKKKVEILPFCGTPEEFVKKAFYNITFKNVEQNTDNGKKVVFVSLDAENKSKMLNNSQKLKRIKKIAERNYGIEEIRIR
ncbi:MAG: NusA-like transcription termination signal-binding factor [Candidatus Diapherotrites archaeon]|nr:NusA-like transcription termination signal-binding factor [Candidatus Diapherotrites archaeon]